MCVPTIQARQVGAQRSTTIKALNKRATKAAENLFVLQSKEIIFLKR